MDASALAPLRDFARALVPRSHVPFSGDGVGVALLLRDGTVVPGVRVESASFSLTIPALGNAYTTAVALGRADDIVAIAASRPFQPGERAYLDGLPAPVFTFVADDQATRGSHDASTTLSSALASSTDESDEYGFLTAPFLPPVGSPDAGLEQVRGLLPRAHVPASNYPVAALLEVSDGRTLPGVNVEHPDWGRILCAERNALGTLMSYGLAPGDRLFLTCQRDPECTPCGACRQLIAELAPDAVLWMDRHTDGADSTLISDLLPGSFRGKAILE